MKSKALKWIIFVAIIAAFTCLAAITVSADGAETDGNDARYGYTLLSENEQYIYDQLEEGVNTFPLPEQIQLDYARSLELPQLERAFALFLNDHPECFWVGNGYSYSVSGETVVAVSPQYNFTGDELLAAKTAFAEKTTEIMKDMPNGSNYDKALYLHDALANAVTYNQVGFHQTAYGALVDGEAVCAGYAAAYQYLLRCAGINASTVTGYSIDPTSGDNIPHAWNIVWMDADTCVYTDVTWDDQADTIYHYYFNISRSEIEADHTTNTELHKLPDCDHDKESYFDANDCNVSFSTSPEEMALHFASANVKGERIAVVYYTGEKTVEEWFEQYIDDLYTALGGAPGAYSYGYSSFGHEYMITVKGDFTVTYHSIEVTLPENVTVMGDLPDRIADGDALKIIINAADGYYFPEDIASVVQDNYTMYRENYSTVIISGKPREDIAIEVPSPVKMAVEEMPSVIFTATGSNSGIISNITKTIKFSFDGIQWYTCSSSSIELSDISPCTLTVMTMGSDTTADSEAQYITIDRFNSPTLTVTQPDAKNNYGKITSDVQIEISTDGDAWEAPALTFDQLIPSIYLVRIPASGTTLASETTEVTLACSHALPDEWQTDANNHYRACHCGSNIEEGPHSFGKWETIASEGSAIGRAKRVCSVCGMEQFGTATTGSSSNGSQNSGAIIDNGSHIGTMEVGCTGSVSCYMLVFITSLAALTLTVKRRK